ncbi:ADP-ribosylglycohydrolase family protein [Luxibacter massiliensis]|uniref:ADP-ribosylglycohydrolase family protein n=1 Tax=Luxibacter massiliensis TaxID=2219695 RepID=UPI000F053368|nr:ADP-ribosylglycohydrolase family protein [Luxibacter massiliensis]
MYGAIIGDMVGAPYEFDRGNKTKDFPMFIEESQFTDDSVMSIAVAEALLDSIGKSEEVTKANIICSMQKWGRRYPDAGYGGMFSSWLVEKNPEPYGSFGNGAAMRVSAVGWLYDSIEKTRDVARWTAEVSHNHPEGVKGAEAVASAIFLARTGADKKFIKNYVVDEFGYDLSRSCDEIRPLYFHDETCQKTVPEAITSFLEAQDFEDVIRTAVSLGGDCDTLTCIAGSIGEAYYDIPKHCLKECRKRLNDDLLIVLDQFLGCIRKL